MCVCVHVHVCEYVRVCKHTQRTEKETKGWERQRGETGAEERELVLAREKETACACLCV